MKKVRVLVVDDNRRIVNLLKNALEKEEEVEVVGTAAGLPGTSTGDSRVGGQSGKRYRARICIGSGLLHFKTF